MTGQLGREDALERARGARAVVMPSIWYEVFPRTVVEAYALAVPVVASRLGSLTEVSPTARPASCSRRATRSRSASC